MPKMNIFLVIAIKQLCDWYLCQFLFLKNEALTETEIKTTIKLV
jgi:hypothetical protein